MQGIYNRQGGGPNTFSHHQGGIAFASSEWGWLTVVTPCRLGDPAELAAESGWTSGYPTSRGDDVMAAALEQAESKASALDLENARLRLTLVPL